MHSIWITHPCNPFNNYTYLQSDFPCEYFGFELFQTEILPIDDDGQGEDLPCMAVLAYSPVSLLAELEILFLLDVQSRQCSPRCTGTICSAVDTKHNQTHTQYTHQRQTWSCIRHDFIESVCLCWNCMLLHDALLCHMLQLWVLVMLSGFGEILQLLLFYTRENIF